MRFITYKKSDQYRTAVVSGKHVVDLSLALRFYQLQHEIHEQVANFSPSSIKSIINKGRGFQILIENAIQYVRNNLSRAKKDFPVNEMILDLVNISIVAPIPDPEKIICVAGNYPSIRQYRRPEYPTIFLKPLNTLAAPNSPIMICQANQSVAYEAELACVIGSQCHNVTESEALDYIVGYTIANDLGDRILEQRTSQWVSGKMFDTFTPIGPFLVTSDEVKDSKGLEIKTMLNGELVQEGNTADMFFNVPEIVSYLSMLTTLKSGDIILTGSPKLMKGKPNLEISLKPGDVIDISIGNLGVLSNSVIKGD